jgi:hypothetical protein
MKLTPGHQSTHQIQHFGQNSNLVAIIKNIVEIFKIFYNFIVIFYDFFTKIYFSFLTFSPAIHAATFKSL